MQCSKSAQNACNVLYMQLCRRTRQCGWRAVRIHISFGFEVTAMPDGVLDCFNTLNIEYF